MTSRLLFGTTLFCSALLVFAIQPMVGRMLLPSLGGSVLVWSVVLVFFQACLLLGYSLAHLLSKLPPTAQVAAYALALVAAGFTLPVTFDLAAPDWSRPARWLLATLVGGVAAPFAVLAMASPLLQRWYASADEPGARNPYHLYAASNAGSLAGLLAYPLILDPLLGLRDQSRVWAVGYVLVVILTLIAGLRRATRFADETPAPAARETAAARSASPLWWALCAAIPSSLLVSFTAFITSDIAAAPLLWIAPLAAYLCSFIWTFSARPPGHERSVRALLWLGLPALGMWFGEFLRPWWLYSAVLVATLFAVGTAYHRELVERKPPPARLTSFYLWISLGGVAGGALTTFGAPWVFDTPIELPLVLALAVAILPARELDAGGRWYDMAIPITLIAAAAVVTELSVGAFGRPLTWIGVGFVLIAVVAARFAPRAALAAVLVAGALTPLLFLEKDVVTRERSLYSRFSVNRENTTLGDFHQLVVGRIVHGSQALEGEARRLPLAYYHPASGVGQALEERWDRGERGPVVVLGLGTGAMAAYARPERPVIFVEIDPTIAEIAADTRYFRHLTDCGELCWVQIGDGRLLLDDIPDGSIDTLVLDAFSGDAIPVHLLTKEALELYARKLEPGGLILVNASNTYVDVPQILGDVAAALGYDSLVQRYWPRERHLYELLVEPSTWVAIAPSSAPLHGLRDDPRWKNLRGNPDRAWTDDWSNLLRYYTWR